MGETRVDLLHLLEDLRDAYPGALEETILTELMANSLDSGAHHISFAVDASQATLTAVDDGSGMRRRDLIRYHDLASSTKTRGAGIGFAGVGIKLGLLACEDVVTETRRGKTHVATRWSLTSRHRAPWKWISPSGLVAERGTGISLKLRNALSPLLDEGFIESALRRHYQPLLDPSFAEILTPRYPLGVRIELSGRVLDLEDWTAPERAGVAVYLARKRKPSAVGYLVRETLPLPEDRRGLAISTYGKVIKRGWDWLGIVPSTPDRVGGMIEASGLAACLTLNKGDFVRVGTRGSLYLGYRKAIQEAVSRQLEAWGDARDLTNEVRRRAVRPLERDLERVLVDLAEEFPLLSSLVEHRAGGQKLLPMGRGGPAVDGRGFVATTVTGWATESDETSGKTEPPSESEPAGEREANGQPVPPPGETIMPGARGRLHPTRYGLSIRFERANGDPELGRLVESTVVVNEAHPAYRRAAASRSEGYHIALATGLALSRLAVEPAKEHEFVTAFLSRWGDALTRPGSGKRRMR